MPTLELDEGFVQDLINKRKIKANESRKLDGKELRLEINEKDLIIQKHRDGRKIMLEVADANGAFAVWFEINDELRKKLGP